MHKNSGCVVSSHDVFIYTIFYDGWVGYTKNIVKYLDSIYRKY